MLLIRSIINMLFVPMLALYRYYKTNSKELKPNMELLVLYCIIAACNIPATRMITIMIRIFANMNIEADSSYYTIAALITSYYLPQIYNVVRKMWSVLSREE